MNSNRWPHAGRFLTLVMLLLTLCTLLIAPHQASAQGPLATVRDALRSNRDLVQANRADAIAARNANVDLLRQTGGARLTVGTCRTQQLVVPHVHQQLLAPLVAPQPLILQQQFNGYLPPPQPLAAPQVVQPQALIVPSYQLPQAIVAPQPIYLQPQALIAQPQRLVVPGCHL